MRGGGGEERFHEPLDSLLAQRGCWMPDDGNFEVVSDPCRSCYWSAKWRKTCSPEIATNTPERAPRPSPQAIENLLVGGTRSDTSFWVENTQRRIRTRCVLPLHAQYCPAV